jgi:hypothetical protein
MVRGTSVETARYASVWALAFFCSCWVLFAGGPLQRLSTSHLPAGFASIDLVAHTHYVAAAAEAQAEPDVWIPREAPRARWPNVGRYPVYQFYSFFPHQAAGLLVRLGIGPYRALLILVLLSFMAGGMGVYGLLRAQGLGHGAGLLACAAYTLAPYHVTDLYGRFAVAELVSFGLVPWVFWGALLSAQKRSLGHLLFSSLTWCLLILSHNIFHAWTVPVVAVWILYRYWMGQDPGQRPVFACLGYGLGLAMALFFFAVPLFLGSKILLAGSFKGGNEASLAPAWVLFHPGWAQAETLNHLPTMGVQIGWPFLGAFLGLAWVRRWTVLRSGTWLAFALAVFGAWSPLNFWPYLGPLQVIQFPMRLLLYACLFGALLLGEGMALLSDLKAKMVLPWLLCGLFLWSLPWKRTVGPGLSASAVEQNWREQGPQEFTPILNYAIADSWRQTRYRDSDLLPKVVQTSKGAGPDKLVFYGARLGDVKVADFKASAVSKLTVHTAVDGDVIVLPALWYPDLYRVTVDGQEQAYGFVGANLAVTLKAGDSKLSYALVGYPWANRISVLAWIVWLGLAWTWERRRQGKGSAFLF